VTGKLEIRDTNLLLAELKALIERVDRGEVLLVSGVVSIHFVTPDEPTAMRGLSCSWIDADIRADVARDIAGHTIRTADRALDQLRTLTHNVGDA
jgi:hypothetical protein